MTESTRNSQQRTFRDKWKAFDEKTTKFFRRHGPNFFVGASIFFLGMAVLWSVSGSTDKSIQCLLFAGLMLGYAFVFPFLVKHDEKIKRKKEETDRS